MRFFKNIYNWIKKQVKKVGRFLGGFVVGSAVASTAMLGLVETSLGEINITEEDVYIQVRINTNTEV